MTFNKIVASERFPTKKALTERVQKLLQATPLLTPISGPDEVFLRALFQRHPDAAEKIGRGIASIQIELNPPYNKRGFWITRTDGSRTDISYRECVSPANRERDYLLAFRSAVAPDIIAFGNQVFSESPVLCPITGESLSLGYSHTDHIPPLTFAALVAEFLRANNLAPADISTSGHGNGECSLEITDAALKQRWIDFHRQHARLRIISPAANMKQGARH